MSSDPRISLPEAVKKVSQKLGKDIATKQFLYWTIKHDISAYCKTGNMPIALVAKPFCKIDRPLGFGRALKTGIKHLVPIYSLTTVITSRNKNDDYAAEYQKDYAKKIAMELIWSAVSADRNTPITWPLIPVSLDLIRLNATFSKKLYVECRKREIEGDASDNKIKVSAFLGDYSDQILSAENEHDRFPKTFQDLLSVDSTGVYEGSYADEFHRRAQYIVPSVYDSCASDGLSQFLQISASDVYFDMSDINLHLNDGDLVLITDADGQCIIEEIETKVQSGTNNFKSIEIPFLHEFATENKPILYDIIEPKVIQEDIIAANILYVISKINDIPSVEQVWNVLIWEINNKKINGNNYFNRDLNSISKDEKQIFYSTIGSGEDFLDRHRLKERLTRIQEKINAPMPKSRKKPRIRERTGVAPPLMDLFS